MSHTTIKYKIGIFICLSIIGLIWLPAVIAAPGDLDTSFSQDGKLVETIGTPIPVSDLIDKVILQPDGKIIALDRGFSNGNFCIIVRYDTNGSFDQSFGNGGKIFYPLVSIRDIALQSDGKIIGVGTAPDTPTDMIVVRFSSNGSVDTTFDGDGQVATDFGGSDVALAVAIQPDGKIVVAGQTQPTSAFADVTVARYNPDGSLDSSFDTDGKVTTDIANNTDEVSTLILQPDGKILIIGDAMVGPSNRDYMLVRYHQDGSLDTTFDNDGRVTTDFFGRFDNMISGALQTDGKIVVTGGADVSGGPDPDFVLVRYNVDGSFDTTFDSDGKVMTDIPLAMFTTGTDITIQSDGKIILAGSVNFVSQGDGRDFIILRYNTDGSLDTAFDNDGYVVTTVGTSIDEATSVVVQPDGKIVAAGAIYDPALNQQDFGLVRYNPDSSIDASFGSNGRVIMNVGFTAAPSDAQDVAIQPDGKIVFAGWSGPITNRNFAVLRYLPNGLPDTSFDGDGQVLTDFLSGTDQAFAVAVQADGRIVAAGYASNGTNDFVALARYNSNGSLDTSFGSGGKLTTSVLGVFDYAYDLVIQPDGKIVVAGFGYNGSNSDIALVRYNSNGSLDTSFGGGGKSVFSVLSSEDEAYAIALQPDGKIVATGAVYNGNSWIFTAARLNTNGSLDSTFDGDGRLTTNIPSSRQGASTVVVQTDGKIVAVGTGDDNFNSTVALVRYNADGSLDAGFDGDGRVITSGAIADAAAIQPNGKIVVGGTSGPDFAVLEYNTDGSPDVSYGIGGKAAFDVAGGAADRISCLSVDPSGRAVVGGNSGGYFAIARVLGDIAAPQRTQSDFDGDGKSDISVFRPGDGNWYIRNSGNGSDAATAWGLASDAITPGDYDGDGKTDLAVFRPTGGFWFVNLSTGGFTQTNFGIATDLPVQGDYDGDGKTDIAVFRPSTGQWYLNRSTAGFTVVPFGSNGDRPVPGDYDADGKTDVAVFRPSDGIWYILRSTDGFTALQFGLATDKVIPADYDGDAKTDVAIFRPSTGQWFMLRSTAGLNVQPWGVDGDIPAPGDFDGDGKADISVFRPSDGIWYRLNSSNGGFFQLPYGTSGDRPIPAGYVPVQ